MRSTAHFPPVPDHLNINGTDPTIDPQPPPDVAPHSLSSSDTWHHDLPRVTAVFACFVKVGLSADPPRNELHAML
ncbi:hypothetical protein SLE2022_102750 [Rubroshorea leprosula]